MTAAFNRELGLKINREVWNGRQLDKIAEYFAEDFVADYSPAFVWRGQQHVREAVERAHATFAGARAAFPGTDSSHESGAALL